MTAFPHKRSRRVASTVLAAGALLVGLVTVPSLAANADASQPSTPSFTLQQLHQHVDRVQQWSETHQAPYRAATHLTQQQFLDYSQDMADYWNQVPWTDFYAQYGCTVTDVDVDFHASDGSWGNAGATSLIAYTCPEDQAAAAAITPDVPADLVAPTGDAGDSLPVATQALSADGSVDLAGTVGGASTCATSGSHHAVCVGVPFKGDLYGSETNLNKSSDRGHLRLANVGVGGACNAGSLVSNSPTYTVSGGGGSVAWNATINTSSKWVAQWYDPDETSQVCGTY